MPHRSFPFFLTLFGVLAIGVSVLFRLNIDRAIEKGPRFWRRLLSTGMAFLFSLGILSPTFGANTEKLKQLSEVWNEGSEIASGKRGEYPFDRNGRDKIVKQLEELNQVIDSLVSEGSFQESEGNLLKVDLAVIVRGVQGKRPTEMQMATCYEAVYLRPEKESLERLAQRLPLLEKLQPGKLSPEVWDKILTSITNDLETVATAAENLSSPVQPHLGSRLEPENQKRAAELTQKIRERLDQLKATKTKP